MQASVQVSLTLNGNPTMSKIDFDLSNNNQVYIDDCPLGTLDVMTGLAYPIPAVKEKDILSLIRSSLPESEPSVITITAQGIKILSRGARVMAMDDGYEDDI